ncbi:hypothetical protein E8E11_009017 [Didymella keratinophila]|nr:hypothetical protein E8E11_009017 [Didymella keratinophila]
MEDGAPLVERVIPSFAEAKYQNLLAWADGLSPSLSNKSNSAAYVYLLRAVYHTTILKLFRPFLDLTKIIRLRFFSSADSTSRTVFSASVKQLKRLIYIYRTYLPHRLAISCIFNAAVLHLTSIIKDVYVCYRVFAGIVPAHLSIALQAGAITAKEARLLNQEFLAVGRHHRVAEEVLTDSYVDFSRAIRKQDGAKMNELADKSEELMLFEDFTQGFGDVRD